MGQPSEQASSLLHPIFQGILQSFADAPKIVARVDYEVALRKHDWAHEFSDDGNVYRRGREQLKALREQQASIDPDWRIWNSIAPPQCRDGHSYSWVAS
jgi:hypothetical protein